MKKPIHFFLIVGIALVLGWTLWTGFHKQHEQHEQPSHDEAAAEGAPKEEEKAEEYVVKLTKEKSEALDIHQSTPEKTELKPQRVAFGRVLDPTPLVTLDGELAAAEAALTASRAQFERSQELFKNGENLARKALETSEAQFRADQSKADGLRRGALLTWGTAFSALDAAARRAFIDHLVSGEAALVRVDLPPGDALAESPKAARLLVIGREEQPIETDAITPAADVDAKTQAQGFILRVDKPVFPLRPGMALTAWLELPQDAREGFAVPRSAILRHDGRTWVYVQDKDEFARKPVKLDTPLDGDKGWFVAEDGGLEENDAVVTVGAQVLLSEEMKAQGGAAEE